MNYNDIRDDIVDRAYTGHYKGEKFQQAANILGEIRRREMGIRREPSKTSDTCADLRKELAS